MENVHDLPSPRNDRYRGLQYNFDDKTGLVTGNPARAACVLDMMKTVKNKCGAEGGTRNHAQALTIEDMTKIINTSEKHCPLWCPGGSPAYETDASFKASVMDHVLVRGFLTSAFTLWTR
jgi:hypothetical protein